MTKEKVKSRFKDDGKLFPNHLVLSGLNYTCELGSFSLKMEELANIGLRCIEAMKKLEEGK